MMPEQCTTIFDLLYDVTGITVYDFVRDIVLSAIIDPVRVKTGPTVVNSKHCIDHTPLVFSVSFAFDPDMAERCNETIANTNNRKAVIQNSDTATKAVMSNIAMSTNILAATVSPSGTHPWEGAGRTGGG